MAKRPIFIPVCRPNHLVRELNFEFEWNPGFAPVQKKKNIIALHEAAKVDGFSPLLEVSSKSDELLGQRLSAFSLSIDTKIGKISVESAFQGSKVFEGGGPYTDLYQKSSREAKKDQRLRNSGRLIGFDFMGDKWPLYPKTAFYDWLYLTALSYHTDYLKRLFKYKGFTDIEFNPQKSINCQARTCALLVSLLKLDSFEYAMRSKEGFIEVLKNDSIKNRDDKDPQQSKAKILHFPFKTMDTDDGGLETKVRAAMKSKGYDENSIKFAVEKARFVQDKIKIHYSASIQLPESVSLEEADGLKEQIEKAIEQIRNQTLEVITSISIELVWSEIQLYLANRQKIDNQD